MCGIAGIVQSVPDPQSLSVLERMTRTLHHRGPDGSGVYHHADRVFLGHRRLSIIDLGGGHQPMANEDNSIWITYNGEIFNHAAVRVPLEQAGHQYRSHCDTETILHAWEQYGADCVQHFRGMFAFAIWDIARQTLFCARDRLGIKPFYYWFDGRTFVFASEIKALLAHPQITARFDETLLAEYLTTGYVTGEQTLFGGIRKLLPGHTLHLANGQLTIRQYWDVPGPPAMASIAARSDAEWTSDLRARLEETVQMRLMSDVPLGMFLSGGVDSSAIAALTMRAKGSGELNTFSVGYAETAYSELGFASQVAEYLGTRHHEVRIGMDEFFGALPSLIWHEDEPICWPSSVSLHFVSRLAREHVTVVLTGEGSDEIFGGYGRYKNHLLNDRAMGFYSTLPGGLRAAVRNWIAHSGLLPAGLRRKLGHTFLGRANSIEELYLDNFYAAFPQSELPALLNGTPAANPYASYRRYFDAHPDASLLSRLLYADQKTYLVELLMKQDQMSMSCSLESRVPLLDHTLVEFAATVPDRLRIVGSEGKSLFKRAVEDLLPHEIVYRPKMGFPTPLRDWLRAPAAAPLYQRLLDSEGVLASLTNRSHLEALLNSHRAGTHDATDRIWRLLNFQIWGDTFLRQRPDPSIPV